MRNVPLKINPDTGALSPQHPMITRGDRPRALLVRDVPDDVPLSEVVRRAETTVVLRPSYEVNWSELGAGRIVR